MKCIPLVANALQIDDVDLNTITDSELQIIAELYFTNLVLVFKNQNLTANGMIDIAKRFGEPEMFDSKTMTERSPGVNGVQRVCAGTNKNGSAKGLFGHDTELNWHSNRPSSEDERKPIIFLYAKNNTEGTRISWLNMALAYNDLDDDIKDFLEDKKGIYGFEPDTYTDFNIWKSHRNIGGQNFIRMSPAGIKGMFFPYYQFFGFKGVDKKLSDSITEKLYEHAYQEKYMYHHNYEDGDVILGDQWLTVHKRWACKLNERMIYRISMDWSKIKYHPIQSQV